MSAVGSLSLLDFVRGNRASSATIMATVGVSSFLLALLSGVLYGFWEDAAARTAAEGASLAERLGGELHAHLDDLFLLHQALTSILLAATTVTFSATMEPTLPSSWMALH